MTTGNCLLCGAELTLACGRHDGYVAGTSYAIHLCSGCGTSVVAPLKAGGEVYDFIYRNSERVPGYSRYHAYAAVIKAKEDPLAFLAEAEEMYFGVRTAMAGKIGTPARILEVGSGLGYTTYALSRAGFDVCGIDLSQAAVERATANFGPLYRCVSLEHLAESEGCRYDVIVATEVIEHVEDPMQFVREIAALLKPDGFVVLTTPRKYRNCDAVWDTDLPPVHLWWLTVEGMQAVAAQTGFSCHFVDTSQHRANWLNPYVPPSAEFRRKPFVSENFELLKTRHSGDFFSRDGIQGLARKAKLAVAVGKEFLRRTHSPILTRTIVAVLTPRAPD